MKQFSTLLIFLFSAFSLSSQTYVDINATGADNGSSWADAFTSLENAILESNPNDELWIAAGTHLAPSISTTDDVYFQLVHDLKLYGGFAGTETSLDQRDPETNVSILSADQNQDDIEGDFVVNREDNNRRVMWIDEAITNSTIIDGLTFMGGTTEGSDASGNDRRGGAILCFGAPMVNNCIFTGNYSYFGGLYPRESSANGTIVTNCKFIANGGGNGAGMYMLAEVEVSDCLFENNSGDRRGMGAYIGNRNCSITNCTFKNNVSNGSSAGALQVFGSEDNTEITEVFVTDCIFEGNSGNYGGAVGSYDSMLVVTYENCEFLSNMAITAGGASTNAFGATTNFSNCLFDENMSLNIGGAIFNQNDDGEINITNCFFDSNEAAERGGAIHAGGSGDFPDALTQINIDASVFQLNSAVEQGGAINTGSAELHITNSLIDFNFVSGTDISIGGAISLNNGGEFTMNNTITNSTITNNSAIIGAGISHWTDGLDNTVSNLVLQNTILVNDDGVNFELEAGNPIFISNGGNLSSDASMEAMLVNTNDVNNGDPKFLDETDKEYHLADDSPGIDKGVADGAPLTDLLGNPRVDEVDMGAYENQKSVGIINHLAKNATLEIHPNPISGQEVLFELSGELTGLLTATIVNNLGQMIQTSQIRASKELNSFKLETQDLQRGLYFLKISNGEKLITKSFLQL